DKLDRDFGKPLGASLCPAVLDRHSASFDPAHLIQTTDECGGPSAPGRLRGRAQKTDNRQLSGLLCARRERPGRRRAAEQRYELAPAHHSITSSARASRVVGTSSPSVFAVLRLITNSYLVGACTGSSAGFSPLRMRSTYAAGRRN